MVSAQLVSGSSYSSQTSASLAQYAYLYKYDMRNRCIGTKLPGCSWEYKVYDLADRLIFSQTGEQRKRGEWQFALPDAMGRECITGICKNAIDPFNNPILNTCVKCERTNNASLLGYSVNGLAYWIMPCTSLRLFGRNSIAMQYSWGTSKGNSMPKSMACL